MKLKLVKTAKEVHRFIHRRSATEITVQKSEVGVLLTFMEEGDISVTLELNDPTDFYDIKRSLTDPRFNGCRNINSGDSDEVMTVSWGNYGEPFEECIQFEFYIEKSKSEWAGPDLSASLDIYDRKQFIATIESLF